jgi:hypothetical protein
VPDFAQNVLATVGVIATIIAAVVTIIMWREGRADRRVKRLFTWEVVSNVEALSMTDLHGSDLVLQKDGTPLRFGGVMVADVRLTNAGSRALRKEDYGDPLTLEMGQSARVLIARVTATVPDRFAVPLTIQDGGRVQLPPVPLNSGASYTVHIVAFNAFRVEAHGIIPDVPKKEIRAQERRSSLGLIMALLNVTIAAVVVTLIASVLLPTSVGRGVLFTEGVIFAEYWALYIYVSVKGDR